MIQTLKLVVVGPLGSGKTTISNLLAEATELSSEYHPTEGVRILEFESDEVIVKQRPIKIDIELWDCSGNAKYSKCWPALSKNAHGIIFVYSGETKKSSQMLQQLYQHFVEKTKLGPKNCIVFHIESGGDKSGKTQPAFAQVSQVDCDLEMDLNKIKQDFHFYLEMLVNNLQENADRQESSFFNNSF